MTLYFNKNVVSERETQKGKNRWNESFINLMLWWFLYISYTIETKTEMKCRQELKLRGHHPAISYYKKNFVHHNVVVTWRDHAKFRNHRHQKYNLLLLLSSTEIWQCDLFSLYIDIFGLCLFIHEVSPSKINNYCMMPLHNWMEWRRIFCVYNNMFFKNTFSE